MFAIVHVTKITYRQLRFFFSKKKDLAQKKLPSKCDHRLFNTDFIWYGIRCKLQMPHAHIDDNNKSIEVKK